jgi:hypothetical protein
MQTIIVLIIVAVCAFFVGRRFYRNFKKTKPGSGCGCDCSGCGPDVTSTCSREPESTLKPDNSKTTK